MDLRTVSFDVPPQEVLTKDSVTVSVDAVVYYRISDPLKAVIQVANYSHSTRLLAATTLRNVLGTRNLSELLTEREAISHTMQTSLDDATDPWGVKVERVEMFVYPLILIKFIYLQYKYFPFRFQKRRFLANGTATSDGNRGRSI